MCPTNFNPADFFILTLAIQPGKEEECQKKVHVSTFAIASLCVACAWKSIARTPPSTFFLTVWTSVSGMDRM